MAILETKGGYPQNCEASAEEVVLTRAESHFLALTLSALYGDPLNPVSRADVEAARIAADIPEASGKFIRAWLKYQGDLVAIAEQEMIDPNRITRSLINPAVFRILSEAARINPSIPAPIPTKEELATAWGVVSRTPSMPLSFQREARQELAKLMGYYPNGGDAVNVGVQVVLKGDLSDD